MPDEHVGLRRRGDAVEHFAVGQREALLLVAVEGPSYREVAQILDVRIAHCDVLMIDRAFAPELHQRPA